MPVRINRVYTRAGDGGETALVGGRRVPKDSPRIEAYGTIDELNSIVGLARAFNEEQLDRHDAHRFLDLTLRQIQDELFDLGSELATPPDFFKEGMYRVGAREVKKLEQLMDECQKELAPLKYVNRLSDLFFVLSRWISKQTGEAEYLWQRGLQEKPKKS